MLTDPITDPNRSAEPSILAEPPEPTAGRAGAALHAPTAGPARPRRRGRALVAAAGLLLAGVAVGCSDEDGDGGTVDEEVTDAENDADRVASTVADATGSAVTEVQQQVDEGAEENGEG